VCAIERERRGEEMGNDDERKLSRNRFFSYLPSPPRFPTCSYWIGVHTFNVQRFENGKTKWLTARKVVSQPPKKKSVIDSLLKSNGRPEEQEAKGELQQQQHFRCGLFNRRRLSGGILDRSRGRRLRNARG
jgi:hypothetical protein